MKHKNVAIAVLLIVAIASTLALSLYNDGLIMTLINGAVTNIVVVLWLLLIPSLIVFSQTASTSSDKKQKQRCSTSCTSIFFLIVSVLLTACLLGLSILLIVVQHGTFPKTSGTIKLKGGKLTTPVTISRESNGMVHIVADNENDLFFAQGYAAAQDRLFQMEIMRRSGQGRVSEIVGSAGVYTDRVMRTAGLYRSANISLSNFPQELVQRAQHFCDGINSYLQKDSARPFEFTIFNLLLKTLKAGPVVIEPYTPTDVVLMTKLLSWIMGSNINYEMDRYKMLNKFGITTERTQQLEPLYPPYGQTVLNAEDYSPSTVYPPVDTRLHECVIPPHILYEPRFLPSQEEIDTYARLVKWFKKASWASNAWAISGKHTKSGMPLLGNDPHVIFQMPALWWAIHLKCDACDIEMIGATLPLVPGIIIGRNKYISFGVTNSFADVQDYFVLQPGNFSSDTYLYNGKELEYVKRTEVIKVAGADDISLEVKQSIFGTYSNEYTNPPVAAPLIMNMTMLLDEDTSAQGFLKIPMAKNYDEFRAAASLIYGPSLNYVYADDQNNIAYQLVGKIPLRKPDHSGLCPVRAVDDTFAYRGYVPFSDMPFAFNPKEGFIASANNRVEPQGFKGYLIGLDVAMEFRALRISNMIKELIGNSNNSITIHDMEKIQTDNLSMLFEKYMKGFIKKMPVFPDQKYEDWRQRLINWDGIEHEGSVEATVIEMWFLNMENLTYNEIKTATQEVYFIVNALEDNNDPACLEYGMTCLEYAGQQLKNAIDFIEQHHGQVPKYGDIHLLQFDHSTLSSDINFTLSSLLSFLPKFLKDLIMSIKPLADFFNKTRTIPLSKLTGRYINGPGGTDTVNAAYVLNYPSAKFNYQLPSWHGPTIRLQIDMAKGATSQWCHIIGNNGNMFSKNYDNFANHFVKGEYVSMSTSGYKNAETLHLEP